MWKTFILSMCFFLWTKESSGLLESLWPLGESAWSLSKEFGNMTASIDDPSTDGFRLFFKQESVHLKEVISKVEGLSSLMLRMEESIPYGLDHMINFASHDADESFATYTKQINDVYGEFKGNLQQNASLQTWQQFSRRAIPIVETNLKYMRAMLIEVPPFDIRHERFIMKNARQIVDAGVSICTTRQSYHFFLNQIIDITMFVEIKALILLSIMYPMIHTVADSAKFTASAQDDMEKTYLMYLNTSLTAMNMTSASIRSCDPPNGSWIRDDTYIEVEKLDQTLLPPTYATEGLRRCEDLTPEILNRVRQSGHTDLTEECNTPRPDDRTFTCETDHYARCEMSDDLRRYAWVARSEESFKNGYGFGIAQHLCNGKIANASCMCSCQRTHILFSAWWHRTDIDENMVMTGLRLRRVNEVVYIQLKQGKLLPNGQIDPKLQNWVPIPKGHERISYQIFPSHANIILINSQRLPEEWVLVGARFTFYGNEKSGLTIELLGRRTDPRTGMVIVEPERNIEIRPTFTEPDLVFRARNSIYTTAVNTPGFEEGFVKLQRSELEHDVGQSVLPLIDSQPVETDPPSPLSGIGLFHKSSPGYAGFVALQLHSLGYKERIQRLLKYHVNGSMFVLSPEPVVRTRFVSDFPGWGK